MSLCTAQSNGLSTLACRKWLIIRWCNYSDNQWIVQSFIKGKSKNSKHQYLQILSFFGQYIECVFWFGLLWYQLIKNSIPTDELITIRIMISFSLKRDSLIFFTKVKSAYSDCACFLLLLKEVWEVQTSQRRCKLSESVKILKMSQTDNGRVFKEEKFPLSPHHIPIGALMCSCSTGMSWISACIVYLYVWVCIKLHMESSRCLHELTFT